MRILVLCKRQYSGKDLLDDQFGRLHELPAGLAALGNQVEAVVHSYRPRGSLMAEAAGVRWHSVDVFPWLPAGLALQHKVAEMLRPDVIWASSDALHAVAGVYLGRRFRIPIVVDLYDDYEAFGMTKLPGLRRALRTACAHASAISIVSHSLADALSARGAVPLLQSVIGNGVPQGFAPAMSQEEARRALDLPQGLSLIGTAGALDESRGISDLFAAFTLLRRRNSNTRLVLAGPRSVTLPPDAIDLGQLPHARVPLLLRALDAGVVCNRDSAFGRACFPQKLAEMAACHLPVVVAAVGDAARMLSEHAALLYHPGDVNGLADALARQLATPTLAPASLAQPWAVLAARLDALLRQVSRKHSAQVQRSASGGLMEVST
jgi:glycosyltransferase involved in cell wall biosynthesis